MDTDFELRLPLSEGQGRDCSRRLLESSAGAVRLRESRVSRCLAQSFPPIDLCICVRACVRACVRVCVSACVRMHTCACVCVCVRVFVFTHVSVYTFEDICIYKHRFTRFRASAYTHTHTHTHVYGHVWAGT